MRVELSVSLQEKEKVKAALLKEVPKEKDKDADKDDAKKEDGKDRFFSSESGQVS